MSKLSRTAKAELTRAFAADLPAAWRRARDRHPDQTPYAFVLHSHEGSERPEVWPVVLTEQGLDAVAGRYVDKGHYNTVDEARAALRWSVADAPDALEWVNGLPTVDAAVAKHIGDDVDEQAGFQLLADVAVPAWRKLDAAGTFGTGADRDRLLLAVMVFDVGDDPTLGTIPLLNQPAIAERLWPAADPAAFTQMVDDLAVSADGRALYTIGTTDDPTAVPREDDTSTYELVAYQVDGRTLTRRWAHRHRTGLGDSLAGIAVDPADGSIVVVRQHSPDGVKRVTLMRFTADRIEPTHAGGVDGKAFGRTLAISADGTRIGLAGVREPTSAARLIGGSGVNPGVPAGTTQRSCSPDSSAAPMTTASARSAPVTQGTVPVRVKPSPSGSAKRAGAPCWREVVSCERPTVT